MSTVAASRRGNAPPERSAEWRERAGRLYRQLRRPARAMIRRAFRGAFGDDEIEDVYSNAWLGTLRALERRHDQLSDEEIRKYVLTAVANHASKELRRRSRRPTTPLEAIHAIPDDRTLPDERAAKLEESRITRDLLATLPPRRRAVMLLRYGWGLEPRQICGLVKGLSPRAYRKEITRGVDELTEKLRLLERGQWCADREPVLKAYAAGACRCRAATPSAAASLALPPLPRVRRQAQRPSARHRVLARGARRGRRDRRRAVLACGPGERCGPPSARVGRQRCRRIPRRRRRRRRHSSREPAGRRPRRGSRGHGCPGKARGARHGGQARRGLSWWRRGGDGLRGHRARSGRPRGEGRRGWQPTAPQWSARVREPSRSGEIRAGRSRSMTSRSRRRRRAVRSRPTMSRPSRPCASEPRPPIAPSAPPAQQEFGVASAAPDPAGAGGSSSSGGGGSAAPAGVRTVTPRFEVGALGHCAVAVHASLPCDGRRSGALGGERRRAHLHRSSVPSAEPRPRRLDPRGRPRLCDPRLLRRPAERSRDQGHQHGQRAAPPLGRVRWPTGSRHLALVSVGLQAKLRRDNGHAARLWMADRRQNEVARVASGDPGPTGYRHYSWRTRGHGSSQLVASLSCQSKSRCPAVRPREDVGAKRSAEGRRLLGSEASRLSTGRCFGAGWLRGAQRLLRAQASDSGSGLADLVVTVNGARIARQHWRLRRDSGHRPMPLASKPCQRESVLDDVPTRLPRAPFHDGRNACLGLRGGLRRQPRPATRRAVKVDNTPPALAFTNSQNPDDPELIRAPVSDSTSGVALRPDLLPPGRSDVLAAARHAAQSGKLQARIDSTIDPPGNYEFMARARDVAGNVAQTTTRADGQPMILAFPLKSGVKLSAHLAPGGARG